MNKYIIIIVVLAIIIGGGAFYRANFVPDVEKAVVTGVEREITIIVHQDTWKFVPEEIDIDQGDKVILTIVNRDEYDHGFAIDAYGISQRMPALETIVVDFVATKAGDFPYYCSVSCGSGIVDGEPRGHFDQVGKLRARGLITETSGLAPESAGEDFVEEARRASLLATSDNEVTELGYDIELLEAVIDEDNLLWDSYATANNIDPEQYGVSGDGDFQSIMYQDEFLSPVLFVFINGVSGEAISVFEIE